MKNKAETKPCGWCDDWLLDNLLPPICSHHMRRRRGRNGIALILVVTLIVIFFLLATTFVSMSTSFLRTSKRAVTRERTLLPNRSSVLDDTFLMLVRDVKTASGNPVATHSLLADLYGRPAGTSLDSSRVYETGGNMLKQVPANPVGGMGFSALRVERLTVANSDHDYQGMVYGVVVDFADQFPMIQNQWAAFTRDQMIGRYLTFADGPIANQTVTIINFQHRSPVPDPADSAVKSMEMSKGHIRFWVLADTESSSWNLATDSLRLPRGSRFVINGRPYAGGSVNDQIVLDLDIRSPANSGFLNNTNLPNDTGLDISESTAANDLFMATNLPAGITDFTRSPIGGFSTKGRIVPSFHRYSQFAKKVRTGAGVQNKDLFQMRRVSPILNPKFTGSNPFARFLSNYNGASNTQVEPFDITKASHRTHLANYMVANQVSPVPGERLPVVPENSLLDVDNDGDGFVDSFWMDLGFAPILTKSGKRVKPLVAVLIEDQGGKLNLNATGSRFQGKNNDNLEVAPGVRIPAGQGYGAAEIRINSALRYPLPSAISVPHFTSFDDFLMLKYGSDVAPGLAGTNPLLYMKQNGNFYEPVTNDGSTNVEHLTGGLFGTVSDYAGQFVFTNRGTPIEQESLNPYPAFQIGNPENQLDINRSPSEPFAVNPNDSVLSLLTDTPYTFNAFGNSSDSVQVKYDYAGANGSVVNYAGPVDPNRDFHLGMQFHELWNRVYDRDFSERASGYVKQIGRIRPFPQVDVGDVANPADDDLLVSEYEIRYTDLLNKLAFNSLNGGISSAPSGEADRFRRQFTTASFSIPSIPVNLAAMYRKILVHNNAERMGNKKNPFTNEGFIGAGSIDREVADSLGSEIVSGLPFNLKPVFGNGVDDSPTNAVPDDFAIGGSHLASAGGIESLSDQRMRGTADPDVNGQVLKNSGYVLDTDNDGSIPSQGDNDQGLSRQRYARQLYTLTLLLSSEADDIYLDSASVVADQDVMKHRVTIAQWVANVVDFQDPDNSMMVFEFDINPFDGWDVDGNSETIDSLQDGSPNTERHVVYGVEKPDLVLSEAIGFHGNGVQDFANGNPEDREFRQSHIPYAPSFIELYNPNIRPGNNVNDLTGEGFIRSSRPDHENYGGLAGVKLNGLNRVNEPVYRIMVVNSDVSAARTSRGANPDTEISAFGNQFRNPVIQGENGRVDVDFNSNDVHSMIYFADPRNLNDSIRSLVNNDSSLGSNYTVQTLIPDQQFFYQPPGGVSAPAYQQNLVVLPGRTAVVGSAGPHDESNWRTILGRTPMDPESTIVNAPNNGDSLPFYLDRSDFADVSNHVNPYVFHGRTTIQLVPGENVRIGYIDLQPKGVAPAEVRDVEMAEAADFRVSEIPYSVSVPLNRQVVNQEKDSRDIYSVFSLTSPKPDHIADSASNNMDPDGYSRFLTDPTADRIKEKDGFRLAMPQTALFRNNSSLKEPTRFGDVTDEVAKQLVLQRLASPSLPFHPISNPYVTVDQLEMNFNSYADKQTERSSWVASNPWTQNGFRKLIRSAQRGYLSFDDPTDLMRDDYFAAENSEPLSAGTSNPRQGSKNVLRRTLLGRWKRDYAGTDWFTRARRQDPAKRSIPATVVGSFPSPVFYADSEKGSGDSFLVDNLPTNQDELLTAPSQSNSYFVLNEISGVNRQIGPANQQLFANYSFQNVQLFDYSSSLGELNYCYQNNAYAPWFRVPNRPLISVMELMEVPCQSNALLLEHFAFPKNDSSNTFDPFRSDIYGIFNNNEFALNGLGLANPGSGPTSPSDPDTDPDDYVEEVYFENNNDDRIVSYLLNFFDEDKPIGRLFEFARTPDPYVGSYKYLDPKVFSGDQNWMFNHPFNWISNRRDPGRLNVNRIFDKEIYEALMGGPNSAYVQSLPFDTRDYRSGFSKDNTSGFWTYDPNNFGENFASAFNSNQVHYLDDNGTTSDSADDFPSFANETGSLKPEPLQFSSVLDDNAGSEDLYDIKSLGDFNTDGTWLRKKRKTGEEHLPMFDFKSGTATYNTQNNPYFKNLMRMRLANMTTNKSSVFNIWITVGYFELEEMEIREPDLGGNPNDRFVTDGGNNLTLIKRETIGKEYGIDTGEVKRDRAFFVYDRSIPVGFVPGFDLNVRKGILLKRIIEEN